MAKKNISEAWHKIFQDLHIFDHDFDKEPFFIKGDQIKKSCQEFRITTQKEVRILCKHDRREDRPQVFIERDLFLLPTKNKPYIAQIIKGEGYVDIPLINKTQNVYQSKLDFALDTSLVGNSEMQHLDYAYASSLIRTFMNDNTLVLTIRGRKFTPEFSFFVGKHQIQVQSVQTEVDAGYEGKSQVVLVEAKNSKTQNVIIRQLYYPFRKWQTHTTKPVVTLFFEKRADTYSIWNFRFKDVQDYNSIELVKSGRFRIISNE